MNQTMPIVKVKDLGIALAAYIAQIRRTEPRAAGTPAASPDQGHPTNHPGAIPGTPEL